jgi:peptidyl-prolyl cis-trans isomerase D
MHEIEAYVKAHKKQFKTNASRSIQYVVFDVDPSVEDKREVLNEHNSFDSRFPRTISR